MLDIKLPEGADAVTCKFVVHFPFESKNGTDLHFVKEHIHYSDGRIEPNVRLIPNYQRSFGVVKPPFRKYKDKQLEEECKNLNIYHCTESQLIPSIQKALGVSRDVNTRKRLARSPYLYGSDITSRAIIKKEYFKKFPDYENSISTVGAYDIETCMLNKPYKDEPIISGFTYKNNAVVGILEDFLEGIENPLEKIRDLVKLYLADYIDDTYNLQLKICKNPGEVCEYTVRKTHDFKVDFVSIWNADFDIPKTLKALKDYGYDAAEVFSDPVVPKEMRFCEYIEGSRVKKKDNGAIEPRKWNDQWHTLSTPHSSYWVDSGAVYTFTRVASGMENSYKLDYILDKNLGIRKLKFDDLLPKHIIPNTAEWHRYMQENHPLEYVVYNIFDSMSLELLDDKTKDLCITTPTLIEISPYTDYNRQPNKIANDLHFTFLEEGVMICSVSDQMADENDNFVVGIDKWIVTLAADRIKSHGICVVEEARELISQFFFNNYDIDIESTYPIAQIISNASKSTTMRELVSIGDLNVNQRKMIGINLTSGKANGYSMTRVIHKAPSFTDLLDEWDRDNQNDN